MMSYNRVFRTGYLLFMATEAIGAIRCQWNRLREVPRNAKAPTETLIYLSLNHKPLNGNLKGFYGIYV